MIDSDIALDPLEFLIIQSGLTEGEVRALMRELQAQDSAAVQNQAPSAGERRHSVCLYPLPGSGVISVRGLFRRKAKRP